MRTALNPNAFSPLIYASLTLGFPHNVSLAILFLLSQASSVLPILIPAYILAASVLASLPILPTSPAACFTVTVSVRLPKVKVIWPSRAPRGLEESVNLKILSSMARVLTAFIQETSETACTSPLVSTTTETSPPAAGRSKEVELDMINPSAAVCFTVKLPTSLPPAFTVTLASRSLVSVLASAITVYFKILLEAELSAVTLHHSGALLVTSNATFDLMFSVLVPPVLEKVIPSVRMFAGIVISGVTVSSLPEHAATKEEKSSADSTRQIWNFSMIFFIMSLRIKNNG